VLATEPAGQGRGLGRAVVAPGLALAGAAGLPAFLETTNDGNVGIYRRWGFEVTATIPLGPLTIRVMRWDG
jgi:ribosomal protein S18 acetylase RimI-like enzyme